MAKTTPKTAQDTLDLYEKLVATNPNVEHKGVTMPYTSRNGHMFSFLTKEGILALRLPAVELEAFVRKYKTKICEQYGRVMKEYVVVPHTLLKKTRELKRYFDMSFAYVDSLKPKRTKKPAAKNPGKKNRELSLNSSRLGERPE